MQKRLSRKVLIVYTDEVESTPRDFKFQEERDKNIKAKPEKELDYQKAYLNKLKGIRRNFFLNQASRLIKPQQGWRIIKNVGDSLVVSFSCRADQIQSNLRTCLEVLHQIWESFNRRLRITVHLTNANDILMECPFSNLKKNIGEYPPWRSLEFIEDDIFGSHMNLAARLSTVPDDGLFIISQQVMEALIEAEELKKQMDQLKGRWGFVQATSQLNAWGPVPLVAIKGAEIINFDNPWLVWEILPPNDSKQPQVLHLENKRFQTLRVLTARFREHKGSLDKRFGPQGRPEIRPAEAFQQRYNSPDPCDVGAVRSCRFFVDVAFRVIDWWSGYPLTWSRDFSEERFRKEERDRKLGFTPLPSKDQHVLPYFVVFTSTPDERTDEKLRDFLQIAETASGNVIMTKHLDSKPVKWILGPQTFLIHRTIRFPGPIQGDIEPSEKRFGDCKSFFLVLFQAKKEVLHYVDNPKRFFEGDNALLYEVEREGIVFKIITYGLLKGEMDGFVILGSRNKATEAIGALKNFLQAFCSSDFEVGGSFFSQIAPITLYALEQAIEFRETHLNMLKDVQDLSEKKAWS